MKRPFLFLLLLLFPFVSTGFESKSNASDSTGLRATDWSDVLPHTGEGSYYNEFWMYHLFLEDDLHLHMTFSMANFGTFKSAVSGGKLFVSNFKGRNYHVSREFTLERLDIDKENHVFRLHDGRDIWFSGELPHEHRVYFETSKDGVSYLVDLNFFDIEPGFAYGSGVLNVGGDDMGMYFHIPKARVKGTVAINDDTLSVEGTAYMDHTYQTDLSSKIVDKSLRYVSHSDDGFIAGYYLIPKKRSERPVIGLSVEKNNDGFTVRHPVELSIQKESSISGKRVPEIVKITYKDGFTRSFQRENHFQDVSFLEEVSGLRKRLVRSFLGGEIIEYVGTGSIDNGSTPVNYNLLIVH
ncbi:lipocalin-like domain-containing protein [Balneolaceae bacterium ANBcel3]|nr:lipocalin-like domain-containing protein [Balneolaceae bacterium ANBcel3]